jgi:hypothetical protein
MIRFLSVSAVALTVMFASAVPASAGGALLPDSFGPRQAVSDIAVLPACSDGLHYACFFDPYGTRNCGCWRAGVTPACPAGYHYACPLVVDGRPQCACY